MSRTTIEGKRHYCTPDGSKVPSVTTILDATKSEEKKQALWNWKKRVGEAKAQEITTEAAGRGTRMHKWLENYIKDDLFDQPGTNPYSRQSHSMADSVIRQGLVNVTEFWGVEVPLYYSGLYAGTTDCVGLWQGKPSILDFKQTNKPKKREWIDDYFIQLAAYAMAHNHMHNTEINMGVILMCVQPAQLAPGVFDTPVYQEFIIEGEEFEFWSQEWLKRVEMYYLKN